MTCSVDGCTGKSLKRGMCNKHYLRWWKHGDALGGSTPWGEAQKFYNETVLPYEGDECLAWPYAKVNGYGQIRIDGKIHLVTRLVCASVNGEPEDPSHEAAHSCGNGHLGCVTKKHLRWATRAENRDDMVLHGRSNKGKSVRFNRLSQADRIEVSELIGTIPDAAIAKKFGVTPAAIKYYHSNRSI